MMWKKCIPLKTCQISFFTDKTETSCFFIQFEVDIGLNAEM